MFSIFQKEIHAYFYSLIAYVIMGFFLTVIGLWTWVFAGNSVFQSGYADLAPLFTMAPYIFIFLCPAITMGLLSEELKLGTLELLLTSPITICQIVIGKYVAAVFVVMVTLLLTSIYGVSIYYLATPVGNIDMAALCGSYIGLLWLSAACIALGLLASACTSSQLVAFLLGTLLCFVCYQGADACAAIAPWGNYTLWMMQGGILYHYEALSRGVIDLRDVIYFSGLIGLCLVITGVIVHVKRTI